MLDEEVKFELMRENSNGGALFDRLYNIGECVSYLAMGTGGFFGVKHLAELGNWGGLLLGIPVGLITVKGISKNLK